MKADEVRVCTVPHVKNLRTVDLIQFLIEKWDGEEYLPSNYMERSPFRSWVANLCNYYLTNFSLANTLGYNEFTKLIKDVLTDREESILEKRNLSSNISPQIALIFKNSKIVVGRNPSFYLCTSCSWEISPNWGRTCFARIERWEQRSRGKRKKILSPFLHTWKRLIIWNRSWRSKYWR